LLLDVGGGLLDEQGFRMELFDRLCRETKPPAARVEQTGAHTGQTDVDAQENPIDHDDPRVIC
jgi:hypothetical protein